MGNQVFCLERTLSTSTPLLAAASEEPTVATEALVDAAKSSGNIEMVSYTDMPLDEDLYGFTIKAFLWGGFALSAKEQFQNVRRNRTANIYSAFLLLYLNIGLQASLMYATKHFVSSKAVWSMRGTYDTFEWHMYGKQEDHFIKTTYGFRRGLSQYFKPENFATLDDDTKENACCIPLSRPDFMGLILFIWTLTCVSEFRKSAELFENLVLSRQATDAAWVELTLETSDENGAEDVAYVRGLKRTSKIIIALVILLPRVLITSLLLWLGCRWLCATESFEDLIMNGVALAFVKDLKDLLYITLVSTADKRELEITRCQLDAGNKKSRMTFWISSKAFVWGGISLAFVWAYIFHWQHVLPYYQWDVADVCEDYLQSESRNPILV